MLFTEKILIKMKRQIIYKLREDKLNLIGNNNTSKPKILVSAIAGIVIRQAQKIFDDLLKNSYEKS